MRLNTLVKRFIKARLTYNVMNADLARALVDAHDAEAELMKEMTKEDLETIGLDKDYNNAVLRRTEQGILVEQGRRKGERGNKAGNSSDAKASLRASTAPLQLPIHAGA